MNKHSKYCNNGEIKDGEIKSETKGQKTEEEVKEDLFKKMMEMYGTANGKETLCTLISGEEILNYAQQIN